METLVAADIQVASKVSQAYFCFFAFQLKIEANLILVLRRPVVGTHIATRVHCAVCQRRILLTPPQFFAIPQKVVIILCLRPPPPP